MLRGHISEEERIELAYLDTLQQTTKTGSTAFFEMMKPYFDWLENQGETLPVPTHNYELLKEYRQSKYEQDLARFQAERSNNDFADTPTDIARFRLLWLQDELTRNVEQWLSKSSGKDRLSDFIEQQKYKSYVLGEIKAIEGKIENLQNTTLLLSHAQICLIRIYEQKPVSKTNAQNVAIEYGHTAPNAGKVLLRKYDELDNEGHRLKRRDLETDIEAVLNRLSGESLQRAERELNIIRNKRR